VRDSAGLLDPTGSGPGRGAHRHWEKWGGHLHPATDWIPRASLVYPNNFTDLAAIAMNLANAEHELGDHLPAAERTQLEQWESATVLRNR